MNRSEIKTRILTGINDPGPTLFTTTQLNELIDDAAEIICGETKSIKRSALIPLQDGKTFYSTQSIADDIMLPFRIWNETQQERLTVVSMDELDQFKQRWINTQNQPELWFPVCWDMFGIWPTVASAGGNLRVDYIAWPGPLYDDSEEPELTITAQNAIVLLCQYFGLLKGWDTERAMETFKVFLQNETIAKAKSGINRISHRSFTRTNLDLPSSIKE